MHNVLQTAQLQFGFFETEKGEVWRVADDRLVPTVIVENTTDLGIRILRNIEREHGQVLRSTRRRS